MSKLEENASLVTALTEIEKKVGQAEIDRNTLKTNLSAKGVDVASVNKMQGLVEKVKDMYFLDNAEAGNDVTFLVKRTPIDLKKIDLVNPTYYPSLISHFVKDNILYMLTEHYISNDTYSNYLSSYSLSSNEFIKITCIKERTSMDASCKQALFKDDYVYVATRFTEIQKYSLSDFSLIATASVSPSRVEYRLYMEIIEDKLFVGCGTNSVSYGASIFRFNKNTMEQEKSYRFGSYSGNYYGNLNFLTFDTKNKFIYACAGYSYSYARIVKLSFDLDFINKSTSDTVGNYRDGIFIDNNLVIMKSGGGTVLMDVRSCDTPDYSLISSRDFSKELNIGLDSGTNKFGRTLNKVFVYNGNSALIYAENSNEYHLLSISTRLQDIKIRPSGLKGFSCMTNLGLDIYDSFKI